MVEHPAFNRVVPGPSPGRGTPLLDRRRGNESSNKTRCRASLAQLVEQQTLNLLVGGSIPSRRNQNQRRFGATPSLRRQQANTMHQKHAWGLFAAAVLGSAAGVAIAPRPARNILRRRAAGNVATLRARYDRWLAAPRIDAALATDQLKAAIGSDTYLGQRRIWVDAHGSTILLHGVVETDDEWRRVDRLARAASPDGSVRNLIQVRRLQAGG
jgi:BON domain-containing protein